MSGAEDEVDGCSVARASSGGVDFSTAPVAGEVSSRAVRAWPKEDVGIALLFRSGQRNQLCEQYEQHEL